MSSSSRRVGLVLAAIAAAQGATVFAQESLRNSLEFDRFNDQRATNLKNQQYNLRLGPAVVNFTAGIMGSYNNNINDAQNGAQEDFIIRPNVNSSLIWQITDNNQISFDVGIGYSMYINHPKLDRVVVTPDSLSDISYDLYVGAVRFNLHDRFNYSEDPLGYGTGAVSGQSDMGRFRNTAGLTTVLRFSSGSISLGYDHGNSIFFNNTFANSDFSSEMAFVRGGYEWYPGLTVGLEGSVGFTDYSLNIRPDNRNYTAGPFVNWRASSAITLEARAGMSTYELTSPGLLGDQAAPMSYYVTLEAKHQITKQISQTLSISRDTSQGVGLSSNFLEIFSVQHTASWKIIRDVSLNTNLMWQQSDDTGQGFGLFLHESYTRYGGGISIGYEFLRQTMGSISYQHIEKESSVSGLNYGADVITLSVDYHF
jgi:hypothetical protein